MEEGREGEQDDDDDDAAIVTIVEKIGHDWIKKVAEAAPRK